MSLQKHIVSRGLGDKLESGLQALGANSARVKVEKPSKATHSIALDEALQSQHPKDARWDYGIGLERGGQHVVAWVEVHHATSSEVTAVLKKLTWLHAWLAQAAKVHRQTPTTFHWVATDAGVHIDAARLRRLAAAGLKRPQSLLRL